ncbi:MAG: sulfatase-like hydrolase/transferase, partial [Bacteroidota bacterium]
GFEEYYGFTSGHWGNYFSPLLEHNGKIVKGEGFLVDDLTDHGMAFMAKNKNRPFFLYLPYNTPHSPMQVPDRFWNRFENASLEQTYFGLEEENPLFTKAALAMVENIDYNVGRLMEKLRALHLEENTIVLYMSDNGPNGWRWNGGMRGKKGSVDEGGVRSPFFIQWKDAIASGKKVEQIASALDILPTLTDLAGIPLDKGTFLDGKSLRPLLEQKQPQWEDRLIFNHWNKKTSVRSQRYRLDNQNRLYDMVKDRGQSQDISEDLPEILDSLIRAKNQWLAQFRPKDPSQKDDRPFTLGHPEHTYTQIPARDGIPHGNITRSNKFPNNTFFTQWTSPKDSISWDVDILADGRFEVALYYTASQKAKGTLVELSMGNHSISKKVNQSHDPPLTGMENDRVPRKESYVKDFIPMHLGEIQLEKGRGTLTLKAPEIPNGEAVDVRLLLFKRL